MKEFKLNETICGTQKYPENSNEMINNVLGKLQFLNVAKGLQI